MIFNNHQYSEVSSIPLEDLSHDADNLDVPLDPDSIDSPQEVQNIGMSDPEPATFARGSRVSVIFEELDRINRTKQNEDDFESDPVFRAELDKSRGSKGFNRKNSSICIAFAIAVWLVSVIYYSSENSKTHASKLWHGPKTNIASINGRNITLNNFSPNHQNLTLAKYRSGAFHTFHVPVRWLSSAQFPETHTTPARGFYLTSENQNFMIKQVDTEYKQVLLESTQFHFGGKFYYAKELILNPGASVDDKHAKHMIRTDSVPQWRHSMFSLFWIWTPDTRDVVPILPPHTTDGNLSKLHFAEFSPSGKHIAFGYNHNLYILGVDSMEVISVTENGSLDIYNGKPDWIYEEEVYPRDRMIWWSPDSIRIAYASINDTEVRSYDLDYYVKGSEELSVSYADIDEETHENSGNYPHRASIRYPRPGTPNPTVRLYSYDLNSSKNTEITGLHEDTSSLSKEFILYDAVWLNSDRLLIKLSDRLSSVLVKKLYAPSKSARAMLINSYMAAEYDGWIEKAAPITTVKSESSEKYFDRVVVDNIVNLAVYDDARSMNYSYVLGPINSESSVAYDSEENSVFGIFGTNSNNRLSKIAVNEKDGKTYLQEKSLMRNLSAELIFSPDNLFVDIRYEGPSQPWQKLLRLADLDDYPDSLVKTEPLNDVKRVSDSLSKTNLPTRIRRMVVVGHGNTQVQLSMIEILPPGFDPQKCYPLLVHAYGGPGSTTVDNSFSVDFQDVACSTLNAVVLVIDPRGTGSDDWKLKSFANKNIGYWGPRDLEDIVSDYIKQNSFIDSSRTALWGWSYGAFLTLKTLESDCGKTFKYGVAVAPVTNWMFYDSIYTERYMGSVEENSNYKTVAQIKETKNFKDVQRFYIMHGTADDNVHIQNTLWLLDKFDQDSVENYDTHFFPDSDHSISYHNANDIVYDKIIWWLQRAFQGSFD